MNLDDLERLAALHEKGFITKEEFESKKSELLGNASVGKVEQTDTPSNTVAPVQQMAGSPTKSKSAFSTKKILLILGLALVGYLGFSLMHVFRPPGSSDSVFAMNPKPVVVFEKAKESDKSSILDYVVTVYGQVRNTGSDGYVRVEGYLIVNGKRFDKYDRRYMTGGETVNVAFDFAEAEAGASMNYGLRAESDQR